MTALDFTHDVVTPRVVFGADSLQRLPDELDRLGARRVLLLATPGRTALTGRAAQLAAHRHGGVFAGARLHVPADVITAAMDEARRTGADLCVSLGGGSAIGLAKAMALQGGPPFVAVPTTYSGSEMTPIWGASEGGRKTTGRDAAALPKTVLYDPLLTLSLPPSTTAASGMNALAHCAEALYAHNTDPVTSLLAEEAIRALAEALPVVVQQPDDVVARGTALYGAWLAGRSLAAAAMGLHHRICHALGGRFDLPHAATHAVVLPHVVAYNAEAAPAAMARIRRAMGSVDNAPAALFALAATLGCPTTLQQLGMQEEDLDEAADVVMTTSYPNPRPFTRQSVRSLLADAFHGRNGHDGTAPGSAGQDSR